MSLTITVRDDQTGETETGHVEDGDYMLVTAAPCYLDSVQAASIVGTVVLTVRNWRPRAKQSTPADLPDPTEGEA